MSAPGPDLRRAWGRVLGVAALALAAALGAGLLVAAARPELFRPPPQPTPPLPFTRLDFHQELTPGVVDYAADLSAKFGLRLLVDLAGGPAGGGLEARLAAAAKHPGRVKVFMNLDPAGCCDGAWAAREAARIAAGRAAGAAGLALLGGAGGALPTAAGEAAELLAACERLGLPVALSLGAPEALRLVEAHPRLTFIALRFGEGAGGAAEVAALLDRHPNLLVSLGGGWGAVARGPEAARAALLAHPDRFLFGTGARYADLPPYHELFLDEGPPVRTPADLRRFFLGLYRLLESRDADIPGIAPGATARTGLGLPREVLERVYAGNATRLLGLPPPPEAP